MIFTSGNTNNRPCSSGKNTERPMSAKFHKYDIDPLPDNIEVTQKTLDDLWLPRSNLFQIAREINRTEKWTEHIYWGGGIQLMNLIGFESYFESK